MVSESTLSNGLSNNRYVAVHAFSSLVPAWLTKSPRSTTERPTYAAADVCTCNSCSGVTKVPVNGNEQKKKPSYKSTFSCAGCREPRGNVDAAQRCATLRHPRLAVIVGAHYAPRRVTYDYETPWLLEDPETEKGIRCLSGCVSAARLKNLCG